MRYRFLFLAALALTFSCNRTDPEDPNKKESKIATFEECLKAGSSFQVMYKQIGEAPAVGDCYVAQGAASDGRYVWFVLRNSADTQAVICKYTLNPFKSVARSAFFYGGHCNDLTYFNDDDMLILAHGQSEGRTLTRINASTLEVLGDVSIPVGSGAIAYNDTQGKYAISQGGSSLHICDKEFKVIKSYSRSDNTGYTAQGMGCDASFVYFPMSGSSDNVIVAYDWNGRFVKTFHLGIAMESESMFCVDGKYYVSFYNSKSAKLFQIYAVRN